MMRDPRNPASGRYLLSGTVLTVGSLRKGLRADVVVVDGNFERTVVMRAGRLLG